MNNRLQLYLKSLPTLEVAAVRTGLCGCVLLALALGISETIEIIRLNSGDSPWAIEVRCGFVCLRERIAIAITITAICLFWRSSTRFLVAALPLGWLVIEYACWLSRSLKVKRYYDALGVVRWPEGRTFGFVGATWWDVVLMLLTMLILAWWTKTLYCVLHWPRLEKTEDRPSLL